MTSPELDPAVPSPARRRYVGVSVLTWIGFVLGGVVAGVLGAVVQGDRRVTPEHVLPWGLVLVVIVLPILVRAASYLAGGRRGGALVALGWFAVTLVASGEGPGGDVILPSGTRTTWYLGASVVMVLVALLWPLPPGLDEVASSRRLRSRDRWTSAPDSIPVDTDQDAAPTA